MDQETGIGAANLLCHGPWQFSDLVGVGQAEGPHVEQVGPAEPLAELRRRTFRASLADPLAILGPPLPCLLLLNDDAPDLPVRLNHGGVDRLPDTTPRLDEDCASARAEGVEGRIGWTPLRGG